MIVFLYFGIHGLFLSKIMVMKLYTDYLSQPSRAILATCMLGSIPHTVIETRITSSEVT